VYAAGATSSRRNSISPPLARAGACTGPRAPRPCCETSRPSRPSGSASDEHAKASACRMQGSVAPIEARWKRRRRARWRSERAPRTSTAIASGPPSQAARTRVSPDASRSQGGKVGVRPRPDLSTKPASRFAWKRLAHLRTILRCRPTSRATDRSVRPCDISKMIFARITSR